MQQFSMQKVRLCCHEINPFPEVDHSEQDIRRTQHHCLRSQYVDVNIGTNVD